MKMHINEVFDLLQIDSFTPDTYKAKTAGMVRDYFSRTIGDITFLMMSNEFTLNKDGKKVGVPDPKKDIWCVLLDNDDKRYDFVIQYSNKEGAKSLAKEKTTYTRQ